MVCVIICFLTEIIKLYSEIIQTVQIIQTVLTIFNLVMAHKCLQGQIQSLYLTLKGSAGAVGSPSWEQRGMRADLCERPTGGDRACGATCELSAGSSRWAHKSFPAEEGTQRKCQLLCGSAVTPAQRDGLALITVVFAYFNFMAAAATAARTCLRPLSGVCFWLETCKMIPGSNGPLTTACCKL